MTTSVPLREKPGFGTRDWGHGLSAFTRDQAYSALRLPFAPPFSEKFLNCLCAIRSQNAALDLDPVIQLAMIEHPQSRAARARLGIARAKDQASHARVHNGSGAHGARLNCNIQVGSLQPVVAQFPSGSPQRQDFRMRGGIVQMDGPVVCAGYHPSVLYHHSPHRDFPLARAPLRLVQRQAHEVHVIWIVDCRLSIVDWHTPRDFRFSIADWRLRRLDCLSRTDSESTRYYRQSKKGLQFNRQSKIFNRKLVVFFCLAPPAPVV